MANRLFFFCREQIQLFQQMHILKHFFVAASREEGYPVSREDLFASNCQAIRVDIVQIV